MKQMKFKIKVGQIWCANNGSRYRVLECAPGTLSKVVSYLNDAIYPWIYIDNEGFGELHMLRWTCIEPEKEVPGIPLDTSLPILQAGYLQDRARKRWHKDNP